MSRRPHPKPYDDVLQTIGWTPVIRLNGVTDVFNDEWLEENGMGDLMDRAPVSVGREDE